MSETRTDIYTRIVADPAKEARLWSVEHTAGKTTHPLRHNGIPYKGNYILDALRQTLPSSPNSRT
jgi:antirestriction protein ArdC